MEAAGPLACSALSGADSAEVANVVSAHAISSDDNISQMARNQLSDFANKSIGGNGMQSFLNPYKFEAEQFLALLQPPEISCAICDAVARSQANETSHLRFKADKCADFFSIDLNTVDYTGGIPGE